MDALFNSPEYRDLQRMERGLAPLDKIVKGG